MCRRFLLVMRRSEQRKYKMRRLLASPTKSMILENLIAKNYRVKESMKLLLTGRDEAYAESLLCSSLDLLNAKYFRNEFGTGIESSACATMSRTFGSRLNQHTHCSSKMLKSSLNDTISCLIVISFYLII